jgi:hypothetical protein
MTVAPERDFWSVAQLAAQHQVSVNRLERVAEKHGIAPAERRGGVFYFDGVGAERIAKAMKSEPTGGVIHRAPRRVYGQ